MPAKATAAPQSFRDVWLLSAGHGFTHWYDATFYLLLPLIGKEIGLTYTEIGLIVTIQHLAGAIANLPGGMIVDTVGKKGYLMAASLFWVGLPYALMSLAGNFWMLLACVTLVGIGGNLWHPAAVSTLAYRYPDRKGLMLSFHGMGGNVGEALAPLVIGALLAWYGWRTVVVINVMPGLAMSALILVLLGAFSISHAGDKNAINARAAARGFGEYLRDCATLLRNKALLLVACSAGVRTTTQVGLFTFLPVYLAYELGYPPFLVGALLTALQIAGFVASPIGGHLSDKMGRKRVIAASMTLTAVVIVGMVLAGKSAAFVVFIALVGFFLYGMRAVLQAWAIESVPNNLTGAGVGVHAGFTSIGAAVAPAIFGMIADAYDLYTGFYFLAGIIAASNFLIFFVPDREAAQDRPVTAS